MRTTGVALALLLAACSGRPSVRSADSTVTPAAATVAGDSTVPVATLERTPCFGTCPVYQVELRRDGTARYRGGEHAPRQGEFEGKVPLYAYALLCAAADDLGLEGMQGRYAADWTDDENVAIEWEREGRTGRVLDYARQAPPAFQAYRALFDELASQIEWQPVAKAR